MPAPSDIAVVTAGRHDVLAAWLCAWLKSPNAERWPVCIGDDGLFPDAFREKAAAVGCTFFDISADLDDAYRFFPDLPRKHAAWSTKVVAMQHCPARWCIWLDHDCEVTGDIRPIVDFARASGKWLSAPFYASFGTNRFSQTRVTQNGLCIVDTASSNLAVWRDGFRRFRDSNDETVLPHCFGGMDGVRQNVCDLFRREWYASPDVYQSIHRSVPAALLTMSVVKPIALVRHWCSAPGKTMFRQLYPESERFL